MSSTVLMKWACPTMTFMSAGLSIGMAVSSTVESCRGPVPAATARPRRVPPRRRHPPPERRAGRPPGPAVATWLPARWGTLRVTAAGPGRRNARVRTRVKVVASAFVAGAIGRMTLTMSATVELRFQRGDASAEEISAEVARILADFGSPDSELAESARAVGLETADLSAMTIEVREGGQGFEPVLTSIIVGITVNAGAKAVEAFWTEVLWPRLRRR